MISVIIPTLNEEACLGRCLESVRSAGAGCEIIVADGGSTDRTRESAERYPGVRLVQSKAGRGNQMNRGASHAQGDLLLFLHADTALEVGWYDDIVAALRNSEITGGAFTFAIDDPRQKYRIVEAWVSMRCRLFRLPYGDQAIFIRRSSFEKLAGYKDIPLMEDVDLVARMKKLGGIALLQKKAVTSGRRWISKGLIRTALVNQTTMLLYLLGVSPHRLASFYYR
jgi:rSAM/selenodomain-associated transferase 2